MAASTTKNENSNNTSSSAMMKDLNETDVSTSMNLDNSGNALSNSFEQYSPGIPSNEQSMKEFLLSYNNLAVVANSIEDVALVMKEPTDIKPIMTSSNSINEVTEAKKGIHATNDDFDSELEESQTNNKDQIESPLPINDQISVIEESNMDKIQKTSNNIPTVKEKIESTLPSISILEETNKKNQKSSEDEQLGHNSITIVKEEILSTLPGSDQISIMENPIISDDKLMHKKVAIILYSVFYYSTQQLGQFHKWGNWET